MSLRAIDMHFQSQFLPNSFNHFEASLVIWTSTTDPDGYPITRFKHRREISQCLTNTLECLCNIREICNTTSNEQNLLSLCSGAGEQIQHGLSILIGLSFGGGTRVFSIIGEFIGETSTCNGISIDNRGPSTGDKCPDSAVGVEDSEFQGCSGFGIEFCNVGFLFGHFAAKRGREDHWRTMVCGDGLGWGGRETKRCWCTGNGPLRTNFKICGLVK